MSVFHVSFKLINYVFVPIYTNYNNQIELLSKCILLVRELLNIADFTPIRSCYLSKPTT